VSQCRLEQNSSHDSEQRKHHRRYDGRCGTDSDGTVFLENAGEWRRSEGGTAGIGWRAHGGRGDEERIGVLELDLRILRDVAIALEKDTLGEVDPVALADQRLAAAVGVAELAEVVLLLITEGRNVREIERDLSGKERRGLVVVVGRRELDTVARVSEEVDTEVRVARADDLAVLLSDLVHVRRRGGTEVPVGHLAAVVGLVEHTLDILLTIPKPYRQGEQAEEHTRATARMRARLVIWQRTRWNLSRETKLRTPRTRRRIGGCGGRGGLGQGHSHEQQEGKHESHSETERTRGKETEKRYEGNQQRRDTSCWCKRCTPSSGWAVMGSNHNPIISSSPSLAVGFPLDTANT